MKEKIILVLSVVLIFTLISGIWSVSARISLPNLFNELNGLGSSTDSNWGKSLESFFGNSVALASTLYLTTDPSCTDSDGGLEPGIAGYVEGIGPNTWPYTRYDACETGDYEGYVKEFFCNGTAFSARRYNCENGCLDGACLVGEPTCTDSDGDTYAIEGGACGLVDCNDNDPQVNPGANEVCGNGIDDNCDGLTDTEDPVCLVCTDADGDTYAIEGGACGLVDCNDNDPQVNPGANEVCGNGIDDNCDGLTDTEDPVCLVCTDADGDGFAFEGGTCGVSDCDDSNPLVNPNAAEVCDNGIDDNCNGKIDAEDAACGAPPNIIVVGWDGAQRDHLMECYNQQLPECSAGLPNLAALGGGMVYDSTITSGDTATKPGWAQIFSGYNAEVIGIYSNGDYQPIPEGYTVFEKLENNFGDENIVTMFISGKSIHTGAACVGDSTYENGQPVTEDQGQPWCLTKDHLDYYENDLRQNLVVGNRALELLETHQNDLFFASFIFRVPDVIGHIGGENSSQYTQAIVGDDIWLGNIVDKLVELGIDDRTLIYVTTDHGFDEDGNTHGNAPYTFLVTNDPLVVREGDRKDIAPTILERYGISLGPLGNAPAVDGFSLYSFPAFECVPEGQAFIDYEGAPACCSGLSLISLDRAFNRNLFTYATGGTGDNSGYCTACGDGICTEPENLLNCSADCN